MQLHCLSLCISDNIPMSIYCVLNIADIWFELFLFLFVAFDRYGLVSSLIAFALVFFCLFDGGVVI